MSTRIDILRAKAAVECHQGEHKCTTGGGCAERTALWAAYMAAAERWGREPGDAARVAEQYASRQRHASHLTTSAPD